MKEYGDKTETTTRNEIEIRLSRATPGPWKFLVDRVIPEGQDWANIWVTQGNNNEVYLGVFEDDAEFIANAQVDMVALVAEIRRLRSELGLKDSY